MAPEISVSQWFNASDPLSLAGLRGKVVVIEAFQMLCPGCVSHGLPQAQQIHDLFPREDVVVIGLHTVFEHHAAMTPVSLEAFIHEYRLSFPIGVDQAGAGDVPVTMAAYGLRGTPSLLLIDRSGRLRAKQFGHVADMHVAYQIARLIHENAPFDGDHATDSDAETCTQNGCSAP